MSESAKYLIENQAAMDSLTPKIDDATIGNLAALSPFEYDRLRTDAAKRLGVRKVILDAEVRRHRQPDPKSSAQGEAVVLDDPDPWDRPVAGDVALDEVDDALARHMAMTETARWTVALWIAHAHAIEVMQHSPRLVATSPTPGSGKTVLLSLVGSMTPRPYSSELLTPAVFFRLAAAQRPTILIDEADSWLKEDSTLPAALNGGFGVGGGVPRCEGDGHEVRHFRTYTPTALAGIALERKLPPALLSRSLIVHLERAVPGEVTIPWDQRRHAAPLAIIARKLARWTQDHRDELADLDPVLPHGIVNRRADKWRPLFAIATLAGGHWPNRAVQALHQEDTDDAAVSTGEALIADIARVMAVHGHDYPESIWTVDLIRHLCEPDESRWSTHNHRAHEPERQRIQPRQLAALLRPFGIRSDDRRQGGKVVKGYLRPDIDRAIQRYISDASATPLHASVGAGFSGTTSATPAESVAETSRPKRSNGAGCSAVADTNLRSGGNGRNSVTPCPKCAGEGCSWCVDPATEAPL